MIKLPGRLFLPGEEPCGLNKRINKYCQLTVVKDVKDHLGDDFKKLQDSFLRPVIQMSEIKDLEFSRHLVNLLVQRRIMVESKELWFAIGQQPMRFSLRDFYLITHLPCRLGEAETEAEKSLKLNMKDPMNFKEDPWMTQGHTTKSLLKYLEDHKSNLTSDQKVRLGATILVQAILIADNKVNQVSIEVHWRAQKFEEFCGLPWGNYSFEALVNSVKTVTLEHLKCEQYNFAGFGYALQFWALSCVPQMGLVFGVPNPNIEFPLCLHWQKTRSPMETEVKSFLDDEKVVVKQVIGDPNQYADLVEDLDSKLQKLIELVNQGYRVKSKDWSIGKVNIKAAMEGIKKNEDSVSKDELINCLTHTVLVLEKRVKTLEKILKEKEDNDVTLMSFFNSQRGRNKKTKVVTENEDSHEQRRGVATPGQSSKSQEVLVGENEGENDEEAEEGATSAEEMVEEQDDEAEKETGDESSKHVVSQHENENENAPEQTGVAAPGQSSKPQDVLVSEIEGENDEEVEEGAYNGSKEQDPGNAADDENIQSAGVDEEDNTEKLEGEEGTQKLGDEEITRESEGIDITGENGETANESSKHQEVVLGQEEGQNDEEAEEEDAPAKDMEEDAPAKGKDNSQRVNRKEGKKNSKEEEHGRKRENSEIILGTPVKPRQFLKFYVRRKSIKLLNKAQDINCSVISPQIINNPGKTENCLFIEGKDNSKRVNRKEGSKEEEHGRKRENSEIIQDSENTEKEKRNNSKGTQKKQRFHRPRIMQEGKKPRNPATTRVKTISKKRKKNNQDEVIVEPGTPEKQSFPKKRKNEKRKSVARTLKIDMSYQKDHNLSADVPLHIEETLMKSASDVLQKRLIKKTNDIVIKSSKKLVTAKVNLDRETIKEWELLMVNDLPNRSSADNETETKWKQEREIFQRRIDLFISRMHLLQGNRKFQQWKGSVVDSVVGVFLTQNVSDHLSSNAFMSVAAKFPADAREGLEGLAYYIEEPQDVNNSIDDDQRPTHIGNDSIPEVEEHEKTAKRKNEKTGIIEDEIVDWNPLRRMYTKEGSRHKMHMDTVNWTDVRLSSQKVFAATIKKRGQYKILARRILKFLSDEVKQNGTIDLEWLRDAPSNLVKRYLLEIEGIGLKSAECVRLLGLQHSAFPVDTNVGRIAVRLGWVPLEPLPNGVQMHQLSQYPSEDSIQKYLWPRLCKLPQETLYELHYQMITFGKVFCTKAIPNCNACPMKSECKYFASAYVSSKVLLEGPEEKTHKSDSFMDAYSQDVDADITSNINLIEECGSPGCNEQDTCCKPMIEFLSSPRAEEIPELMDIEDAPRRNSCEQYAKIPEIDIDMDALKRNVEDALVEGGKMLNNSDDEISKALVVLTPENACIPIKPPQKIKYYDRLRTEHVVYVLPDNHELLRDFERRELDDPSPYLLAIWQPGETSNSFTPPKKKCNSDGSNLCNVKTCSYCWSVREQNSNIFRGTILIPCRTAMRGAFPLNGTYFQTNEVFADHETSLKPIEFPREWCEGLEKRALYCGSTVTSIFRFLDARRIQLCFWTGFLCMRAFDRKQRNPKQLVPRLHTPPVERGAKFMKDDDF